jgi:hypothetical protein
MTDGTDSGHDAALRQGAAVFLGQVLGLDESPEYLANDLSPIKRDTNAGIFTIQLDSSVGPAAFLVYAYVLDRRGGDGRSGQELFDAGLQTLQQAARYESPGPRALAHAESGGHGYILATTPGTYRALVGESGTGDDLEATTADLATLQDLDKARGEAAETLLATLKQANEQATLWLDAIRLAGQAGEDDEGDLIEFNERETELALHLLDETSIGNLLQALNLLVSTAQESAASAIDPDGGGFAP